LDLNNSNQRLGSGVAPPLGVVKEEVAVLIALVRRHRRAVGAAVGWAVDDEIPGAVEEEVGLAAVRRVPPGLLDALHVHALGVLGIFLGRAIQKAAMPTGEGDQDGHFFFNHPERGGKDACRSF